jgi:hypothetical protein
MLQVGRSVQRRPLSELHTMLGRGGLPITLLYNF